MSGGKLGRDDGVRGWAVVHEDQGNVAEHRQGKARDGRSETDGSGSRCRLERVADDWHGEHSNQGETEEEHHDEKGGDEAYVQYIGKGGGKKGGKGFQGYSYICGGFGHSQWDCHKGKGKGKAVGKDGGYGKGYGKDGCAGKAYGKGKGGDGKGGAGLRSMSSRIARRTRMSSKWRRTSQRFSSSVSFRTKKHWRVGKRCP